MASRNLKASDWILDSGCTYHMTHNKNWLLNYQKLDEGKVLMNNNHSCFVASIGCVKKKADCVVRIFKNVRYVLELSRFVISICILDDLDYTNKIEEGSMYIARVVIVLKVIKIASLYYLIGETLHEDVSFAITQNESKATL